MAVITAKYYTSLRKYGKQAYGDATQSRHVHKLTIDEGSAEIEGSDDTDGW